MDTNSPNSPNSHRDPAIRVMLMPKDTNAMGTIFGGIILSYIDLAGAIEAYRHVHGQVVTVAMDKVEFHEPVFVGDIVSLYCTTRRMGTTSITIHVLVEAERRCAPEGGVVKVTEAEVVYVRVDENRKPIPIEEGKRLPMEV
jgi:acyl-CoA thioesterase YciA